MNSYGGYPDLAGIRRVLVIKLRHHGDVLLTSPVFSALKQAMPGAEIDAYVYRDTLPMLDGHPSISGYRLYDRSWKDLPRWARLRCELRLLREINQGGYDMVINLTEGDRGAIAMLASGARYRVGWDPGSSGMLFKRKLYTHIVRRPALPRHMVEQNLDAVRRVGIFPALEKRELHFHIPQSAKDAVSARLMSGGVAAGKFILIHPTSRWLFKCWPIENVTALICELHARNRSVVISSAPDSRERKMISDILTRCAHVPVLDLGGQLTLKELGAIIDASACLVGVDSVPMHLASALKKPSLALFGPSSELVWGTWRNPDGRVLAQPYPCRPCNLDGCGGGKVSDCLATLSVSPVLDAIEKLLEVADEGRLPA